MEPKRSTAPAQLTEEHVSLHSQTSEGFRGLVFFVVVVLAALWGMQDLSSLTRD